MLSPLIAETIRCIQPLLTPTLATALHSAWDQRTKPPRSLGKLEDLVVHYGLIRNTTEPVLRRKAMFVFCADHGVAMQGVSAYPQQITAQMVRNFLRGGAAINVLCRAYSIEPFIVDMGVIGGTWRGLLDYKIAEGTQDFSKGPAMTHHQLNQALAVGIELATDAASRFDVVGIGEMGIGNTTSASALLSAFSGWDPSETVGAGTGVDAERLWHKIEVIRAALRFHQPELISPFDMLRCVGGFEIAAMAGFMLGAACSRLPIVVDGFIASAAALAARAFAPDVLDAAIFSHLSQEKHHGKLLRLLGVEPLVALDLRLGEGTGAAIAIHLLEAGVNLFNQMARFEDLQ